MWINLFCVFLPFLAACQTPAPSKPVEPPDVVMTLSWPKIEWQNYVFDKVKDMPLAADANEFCPNGLTQANWVHLLSAMVKYESNYNPSLEYKESFKDRQGLNVISTGLFQVSQESSRGYGFTGITTAQLKDPYKNIDVAVAILRKWIKADGLVANHSGTAWRGGARYWSVLRTTGKLSEVKKTLKVWCE